MKFDQQELKRHVHQAQNKFFIPSIVKAIYECIDLTSLNDTDTEETLVALSKKTESDLGHVAAMCVYPKFVKKLKHVLSVTQVKIATVANFPNGTNSLKDTLQSIEQSIYDGAQEIDVVYPYQDFLKGDQKNPITFIEACKKACGNRILLKVILETGAFTDLKLITQASQDVLQAGADFIKTSTGKIANGATLEAAASILLTLREFKYSRGFKASGGIRTIEQAAQYLALADSIMGKDWVCPATFRIGASQLIDALLSNAG